MKEVREECERVAAAAQPSREAGHMEFVHDCADVLQTVVDEGIKHPDTAWALRDILNRARTFIAVYDTPATPDERREEAGG